MAQSISLIVWNQSASDFSTKNTACTHLFMRALFFVSTSASIVSVRTVCSHCFKLSRLDSLSSRSCSFFSFSRSLTDLLPLCFEAKTNNHIIFKKYLNYFSETVLFEAALGGLPLLLLTSDFAIPNKYPRFLRYWISQRFKILPDATEPFVFGPTDFPSPSWTVAVSPKKKPNCKCNLFIYIHVYRPI